MQKSGQRHAEVDGRGELTIPEVQHNTTRHRQTVTLPLLSTASPQAAVTKSPLRKR